MEKYLKWIVITFYFRMLTNVHTLGKNILPVLLWEAEDLRHNLSSIFTTGQVGSIVLSDTGVF